MKVIFQGSDFKHDFSVELDGATYEVTIWTNSKGKFIDDRVASPAFDLLSLEQQEEVQNKILNYLSDNWGKYV